uniref:Uncharacterized protein n=1 Tax=Aegilops tauschii subsp. strangulata TaxID=200361 RepID=A0A453Q0U6_AEGTS
GKTIDNTVKIQQNAKRLIKLAKNHTHRNLSMPRSDVRGQRVEHFAVLPLKLLWVSQCRPPALAASPPTGTGSSTPSPATRPSTSPSSKVTPCPKRIPCVPRSSP